MKRLLPKTKQGERNASNIRHTRPKYKKPISFIEEAPTGSDVHETMIFGKFTRPVGSYRRGYKKPMEG